MNKKKKIILTVSWIAVIMCMGVIFMLSAQDGVESESLSGGVQLFFGLAVGMRFIRKTAHFLEFAGLAVLWFNAFYQTYGKSRPVASFAAAALYAASDEFHQLFVEGRACRLFDLFVDCSGALCGVLGGMLLLLIFTRIKGRKQNDRQR